ncbi:unnamed protein product [Moneuplotes crassus]|uniref:Acyltransferase 3 domain-containing protein n=1 Tax=Euplotes crassus TaxID=5936 RepID=A0AAD1Y8M0_EUPCR|nr:unnamed protein product [Moneuplotes crassus]
MKILTLVFLALLLSLVFTSPSPDFRAEEEDTPCLKNLRRVLSPEGLGDLVKVALNSAKGPNELGDFESCHTEGLEYVMLSLVMQPEGMAVVKMGLCVPQECASQESFNDLSAFVQQKAQPYLPKDMQVVAEVGVPREVLSESMSAGGIIVLVVTGFVVLLWFLGMLISYTNLGNNGNFRSDKIEDRKMTWALALHSWNPIVNLSKLFTVKDGGDKTLNVLNGVRVLSIGWVILGHSFAFVMFSTVKNGQTLKVLYDSDWFSIVPGGVFAVDTFFFLSGFLTFALLISKMYPKRGMIGIVNTLLIYFHRYYRLIFPMIYIQFFTMYVVRYLGSGPLYRTSWDLMNKSCFANPWQNFLFIANLYPWQMGSTCIGWVWYLMCDMQFFVISPPIIIIYCLNRKIGKLLVVFLVLASMVIMGVMSLVWDISMDGRSSKKTDVADYVYNKPWTRMGAYFVGALFGISYFELTCRDKYQELSGTLFNKCYDILKNSQVISLLVCCFGVGVTALYVFPNAAYARGCNDPTSFTGGNCWPLWLSSLYNFTARPFFVAAVGLIIAPTFVGRLRVIKGFLGAEMFEVLARLNYMVYMIHCVVMMHFLNDLRASVYVTSTSQWFFAIGSTVISFLVGIPLTLICEVPFMNLEKYVLFPKKPKRQDHITVEAEYTKGNRNSEFYKLEDHDDTMESGKKLLE